MLKVTGKQVCALYVNFRMSYQSFLSHVAYNSRNTYFLTFVISLLYVRILNLPYRVIDPYTLFK